ncbi:MAG: hypothetical protein AABO57_14675 [Acidobacteriota bacterium]
MDKDKARARIGRLLAVNGFTVEYISEEEWPTADLKVSENVYTYFIEIKAKGDDEEKLHRERQELLKKKVVNPPPESIRRRNRLSGIIRYGAEQLRDYPSSDRSFKLMWVQCAGNDPVGQMERVRATLYGIVYLGRRGHDELRLCYYFDFNEFFYLQNELDAVIVESDKDAQLCINSFSPRRHSLRQSGLYRWLEDGICDPEIIEQAGHAYSAHDCNLSRHDVQAILDFVRSKYDAPSLMLMHMMRHSGTILVPTSGSDSNRNDE